MIRPPKPIICRCCGKPTGCHEGPMMMVIPPEGLKCKECGYVFLKPKQYELRAVKQAPNFVIQSGAQSVRKGFR